MSKFSKIVKENIKNLLGEGFEDMEIAFGTKEIKNLSDAEKNQFGPMGQLKTDNGASFKNPTTNGMKEVDKANKQGGTDAKAYYKEVAKKIKDFQTPNDKEKFDAPKTPTNAKGENERIKTTGYDVGISGMEVTADLAAEEGGDEATKKLYKDRMVKLNKGDKTYEKMVKNAKETNTLKYKKEANNTRPVKQQKSPQPMGENIKYEGVDSKNIFKANGKLVSEEQVIKLANKVPSRVKVDESVFAITDGENTYKILWEGDSKSGEPIVTNFKNTELVKEDIQEMKRLWNFKTSDAISTKKNITESGEDAFKRMLKLVKENAKEEEEEETEEEDSKKGLKGNQKKLDKNKNNKLDSEDFKILRSKKK